MPDMHQMLAGWKPYLQLLLVSRKQQQQQLLLLLQLGPHI
jgi:hypothetical protein